jgi:hypothetical protein
MFLDTLIIYEENILDKKFKPEPCPLQNILSNVRDGICFIKFLN